MPQKLEPILLILYRKYKFFLKAIKIDEEKQANHLHYNLSLRDKYIRKVNDIEKDILLQLKKSKMSLAASKDHWIPIRNGFLRSAESIAKTKVQKIKNYKSFGMTPETAYRREVVYLPRVESVARAPSSREKKVQSRLAKRWREDDIEEAWNTLAMQRKVYNDLQHLVADLAPRKFPRLVELEARPRKRPINRPINRVASTSSGAPSKYDNQLDEFEFDASLFDDLEDELLPSQKKQKK